MTSRIYLDSENRLLVQRWLEEARQGAAATLVVDPAHKRLAEGLCGEFAAATAIELLEGATPKPPREDTLVLPLVFYSSPLEHRIPLALPELAPHYPTFRNLWLHGFRTFDLYSLAGVRTLRMDHALDAFAGKHQGQRCFVIGNGPSLNQLDLSPLQHEITLGANRGYLAFERMGGPFTYWGVSDHYQIQEYGPEYEHHVPAEVVKFFPFEYLPYLRMTNTCPVPLVWVKEAAHQFSNAPEGIYTHFTVTYMLMQIAAVMGCNPIILIGVDHRYGLRRKSFLATKRNHLRRYVSRALRGTFLHSAIRAVRLERLKTRRPSLHADPAKFWTSTEAKAPTHFDSRYTEGDNKRFLRPQPELMDGDYECAARWAREHGVDILNATPDSALKAFPTVDYDSLFG